eukprot:230278-Chlamydomonas_euryale.AAC.2
MLPKQQDDPPNSRMIPPHGSNPASDAPAQPYAKQSHMHNTQRLSPNMKHPNEHAPHLGPCPVQSLEEPRYLIEQLFKSPRGCLSLLGWLPANTGDIARKYISDPELLRFIDAECYIFSTVAACATPMVTSGMVFSDRHYGGIRYPKGGVGTLARKLAEGIEQAGGAILYRANATCVLFDEAGAAAGVRLSDGREFRSRAVVSNATRWDTFGRLLGGREPPEAEKLFLSRYKKSPSFFSMHLGIRADVLPPGTECHHVVVDDWDKGGAEGVGRWEYLLARGKQVAYTGKKHGLWGHWQPGENGENTGFGGIGNPGKSGKHGLWGHWQPEETAENTGFGALTAGRNEAKHHVLNMGFGTWAPRASDMLAC